MYLKWLRSIRTKNRLKRIYKKYGFNVIHNIATFFLKNLKKLEENNNNLCIVRYIRAKKILSYLKKFFKKKIKIKKLRLKRRRRYKFPKIKSLIICKTLYTKQKRINQLLYFLKYFLILRKRESRIFNLSRVKARLSKRRFFKKKRKIKKIIHYLLTRKSYKKIKYHLNLVHLNMYFFKKRKYQKLNKLHDIKRRYIRYLNNNRNIYKIHKFRLKHNFKFIKRHIRSIAALGIKSRMHKYEYTLRNIAIKLRFAYTYRNANMFVKGGFMFINGIQSVNPLSFIYKGDIVELIFSKFLFKLKKRIKRKINVSMRKYKKYNWRTLKNKIDKTKRRIRISRFGEKVLHYKSKLTNSFQYDFRTMSFMLVKELQYKKDFSYLNRKVLPLYLLKIFNWKIIS